MANVEHLHPVIENAIENVIGIPDERHYVHAWPLAHRLPTFWMLPNI
jgi:hypothetical protein